MNDKPEQGHDSRQSGITLWECPNCGQRHFGDAPPDMCDYCGDFTTWRRLSSPKQNQGRVRRQTSPQNKGKE